MPGPPPRIFNRAAIAQARARAERVAGDGFLFREAAEGLAARLRPINREFQKAGDIESWSATFDILQPLARSWMPISMTAEEALELGAADFDLVTSLLALHMANDLPGILIQARRALIPDGVFAAALFGGETLCELRESLTAAESEAKGGASLRVAPFADVRDVGLLAQRAGFALPVADIERTTVLYPSFSGLIHDLRAHGQTNVLQERPSAPISRGMLAAAQDHYRRRHSEPDGRLRASFDIVYLIGWSPSDSQPRPLRPGSAQVRLANVLGPSKPNDSQT
jgi:SAM-dependent methyltransferase